MKPSIRKWICAGGRLSLASLLAVITANAIAHRFSNCPSIYNSLLGRVPKPGTKFHWQVEGNGQGMWTTNCVRRPELPRSPSKNILILGDSYVEALQVNDDEHFAHILEQRLRLKDGEISVLPLGQSGRSVADYVANAHLYEGLFSPHWVVVQICDADLCQDAWNASKPAGYAYFKFVDPSKNIAVFDRTPKDVGIVGKVNDKLPYLLPIVAFAQDRRNIVQAWLRDRNQPWFHAEPETLDDRGGDRPEMAGYPVDAEVSLLADAYAKRVSILYLPPFDPQDPETVTKNETILRMAAERSGIHFVSLRGRFAQLAAAGHAPYGFTNTRFNQGHWNRYGHEAAADLLVQDWNRIQDAIY